jgi:phosphoesterase RecJ-like protein
LLIFEALKRIAKVADLLKYAKELLKLFSTSDKILLICHINPDGDAVGSQLALFQFLKNSGRNAEMISPNNLQEFLKWMPYADLINIFIRQRDHCRNLIRNSDLVILLDFNQPERLGEMQDLVMTSKAKKVIIDHHLNPRPFADIIISDPSKCSTSELVYELISILSGKPFMNQSIAEALYVGIITDTGNFEHGNYSGQTLRIIADILDAGIDRDKILNLVYNNFSEDRMRLQGFALNKRMIVIPEYETAYIYLTMNDLASYNHVKGDTEGFVNMPLSIKGIRFAALFIEKDKFIKLSFRSKGNFPVNEFASEFFSGGGHLNASGGEFKDTLENTIEYFLKVLKENFTRFNKK